MNFSLFLAGFARFLPARGPFGSRLAPGLSALLIGAAGGCGGGGAQPASTPSGAGGPSVPLAIEHEPCDVESSSATKVDSNGDGKPDIVRVMSGGKEVCRAVDLNLDGRADSYLYFDSNGALRRRESDFDRDGKIDEIAEYAGGVVVRKSRETNLDGKLDTWDFYEGGKLVRRLRDADGNGRVDQWWTWPHADKPDCPVIASDRNGDGQPEPGDLVDTCAPPPDATAAASGSPAPPSPSVASAASASASGSSPPAPPASSATPATAAPSSSPAPAASARPGGGK